MITHSECNFDYGAIFSMKIELAESILPRLEEIRTRCDEEAYSVTYRPYRYWTEAVGTESFQVVDHAFRLERWSAQVIEASAQAVTVAYHNFTGSLQHFAPPDQAFISPRRVTLAIARPFKMIETFALQAQRVRVELHSIDREPAYIYPFEPLDFDGEKGRLAPMDAGASVDLEATAPADWTRTALRIFLESLGLSEPSVVDTWLEESKTHWPFDV